MNIYLVHNPLPFPTSEYGALYVVAAESLEVVERLLIEDISDYDKDRFLNKIRNAALSATLIGQTSLFTNEIIDNFCT